MSMLFAGSRDYCCKCGCYHENEPFYTEEQLAGPHELIELPTAAIEWLSARLDEQARQIKGEDAD